MGDDGGFGRRAEALAAGFLELQGYAVLGRNVRVGRWEADVLARRGETLVLVEVKARRGGGTGFPEEAVGVAKRRRLLAAARRLLAAGDQEDVRLDLVTVCQEPRCFVLRHLRGALWG